MTRIAITGGIACGKSLVASLMTARGIPVCEADDIGHELLRRGTDVHARVAAFFGPAILDPRGEIDRDRLGAIVFEDPEELERLNALTHPEILSRLHQWLAAQTRRTAAAAGVIPLLYEVGDDAAWNVTVCVAAPVHEQQRRLRQRGLSAREAQARIAAQMPLPDKMERSDCVIYNCGGVDLLEEQTDKVVRKIRGE